MKSPLERSAVGGLLPVSCLLTFAAHLLLLLVGSVTCQSPVGSQSGGGLETLEPGSNFPYYMQSPQPQQPPEPPSVIIQRTNIPLVPGPAQLAPVQQPTVQVPAAQKPSSSAPPGCLYGQHYFAHFDQCLERKPYATIGLPAFKNDDLLAQRWSSSSSSSLSERHGCSFILTNGLFKNYQLTKYSLQDSDTKCLDDNKLAHLSMKFSNVTLYYLWQLRCLNQANQLLDDATLNGKTATIEHSKPTSSEPQQQQQRSSSTGAEGLCVGSSQNFGFTSLQVSNIEAHVELAIDIYRNWRVTNITLAMLPGSPAAASNLKTADAHELTDHSEQLKSSAIRDFTFESLDGDELNWRYLNLYENWTRNRLHTNFLEQFKRFMWISLQRCLSESADKLPVKLVDLFGQQRYNS